MNVSRDGRSRSGSSVLLKVPEQAQPRLDRWVLRVEIESSSVRVNGIGDLVVARLVEGSQVEPNFRDVRIESNRSRVRVESVSVLVDLEVEDSDRAPEGRVSTISVDGLLVGFVGFVVALTCHEGSSEEVPALSVGSVLSFAKEKNGISFELVRARRN